MLSKRTLLAVMLLLAGLMVAPALAEDDLMGDFTVSHYFGGFGGEFIDSIVDDFIAANPGLMHAASPVDHEQFKTSILVQLAGGNPPDTFSYWAGARIQFIVDDGFLMPIDDIWEANDMGSQFPQAVIDTAVTYDMHQYALPLTLHWVGMFYNSALFEQVGAMPPTTWDELVDVAEKFKMSGIPAFALGSRDRWPAQFWFDMILLRTAGNDYREALMGGEASYTDPEVARAFGLWKELVDAGYFYPDANAYGYEDAASLVANGEAAMTLMGTWIGGYFAGIDMVPVDDFDYFSFPTIDADTPRASLGPIDTFVISAEAANADAAKAFLVYLTDPAVQWAFAEGAGNLAPSLMVDTSNYNDVVARIAAEIAESAVFAFNYDLATPPPVAEVGLNSFSEFMANPGDYEAMLERVQADAQAEFAGMG
ncbi:MAG: extracellular solute-binding protein [Chloroflexi bacterium]|nr:extracellular solute-binding protein [Chloroflexota bacterium]MCY3582699.1 extracellular solute-binding protein [Chloroflexota bacterium]MCY3715197.1 extracellular solute-binding protein [Chloroflexota bacterium]MDE2649968.1 extracellular solute-binding protein [Chloroflexota bacterium]MXX49584.1 extracellular solute-binding protein [Chloroflexota bacterium]